MIQDLDLPKITEADLPVPLVSTEDALRWRIAKAAIANPIPREEPQGEPFVWDTTAPPSDKLK